VRERLCVCVCVCLPSGCGKEGCGLLPCSDVHPSALMQGEKRLVVTLNGKFLPYVEGKVEENVAQRPTGDK
jgi:hypothetical protein